MNNMTPMYATKKFNEIYSSVGDITTENTFLYDYHNIGIPAIISDTNATTLFYLLSAKFGNSPIANYSEDQFKLKLFSVIFQYGPTWEKKLEIQSHLRDLGPEDIVIGGKAIYNHAYNPGEIEAEGASSTTNQPELQYINDQNVTNYTKSQMDAYTQLWDLLATDVTSEFLARFNNLFKKFVQPGTYFFVEDTDEQ